jgi:hypothetical protein
MAEMVCMIQCSPGRPLLSPAFRLGCGQRFNVGYSRSYSVVNPLYHDLSIPYKVRENGW